MHKAFILLNVKSGYEENILETLLETKGVISAHPIYGKYDFMVTIESSNQDNLKLDIFSLRKMN